MCCDACQYSLVSRWLAEVYDTIHLVPVPTRPFKNSVQNGKKVHAINPVSLLLAASGATFITLSYQ